MKFSGYRQCGIALLLVGVALCSTAFYLAHVPPEFLAVARIRIQRLDPRTPFNSFLPGADDLAVSDVMLSNVIENLGLQQKWGDSHAGGKRLELTEATRQLRQHLELSPVRSSVLGTPTALTEIRVTDNEAGEAAEIANAIAESIRGEYAARNQEAVLNAANTLEATLEQQWKEREQRVRLVREQMNALRIDLGISEHEDPPPDCDPEKLRSFNELKRTLAGVEADLHDFETNITAPEMRRKVTTTVAEIADHAYPPRQPVWPGSSLMNFLFISAASLTLAGMVLIAIPQWLSVKTRKR